MNPLMFVKFGRLNQYFRTLMWVLAIVLAVVCLVAYGAKHSEHMSAKQIHTAPLAH